MSTKPDVEALADALRTDPEAREKVVDAIVQEMNVDEDTQEGAAAQSYRRDVLKALGLAGTAAVAGGAAQHAMTEPAAAAHGNGQIGVAGDPLDKAYVTSIDGDGDTVSITPGGSADQFNGVHWVDDAGTAANIQTAIDDALAASEFGDDAAVALRPGSIYNIDGEIHVKEGVTLYGMGARLNQQSDANCLFVDHDAHVVGPLGIRTQGVTGYTSDTIVFDSSRAGGRYNAVVGQQATVSGPVLIEGDNGEGNGIAFRTNGDPIANGVHIGWFTISGFTNGILADTASGGWVNGVVMQGSVQDATTLVNHTGTESFSSVLYGQLQSNANTDYGIRSQVAGKGSIRFHGQFWDPGNYNVAAYDGDRIKITGPSFGDTLYSNGNPDVGTTLHGIGEESANAEEPQSTAWLVGEMVDFTDTGDGSGNGLYVMDPSRTWRQIA